METVLITGASSGIGEALAKKFANGGHDLVLVARSVEKLKALSQRLQAESGIKVRVEPADLSKISAAEALAAKLHKQKLEIDILVNCAGVLENGYFVEMSPTLDESMIDLNISGLTAMLGHFLPPMVERGRGRVLNVASIAAFQPVPGLATYAASKAFVLSLTESLSEELAGTGVTITALCPGVTATKMVSNAQQKSGGLKIPAVLIGEAEDVAEQGYRACLNGEVIRVPGTINLAATIGGRATPKWLLRRISGMMGRYSTTGKRG